MKHLTAAASAVLLAATAGTAMAGDKYDKSMKMDKAEMQNSMYGTVKQSAMSAEQSAMFDSMDSDMNRSIDFTEFSTYLEQNYGMDASQSAQEFVRLSDENGVVTDMSFAGMNMKNLPHKHMDDGTTHNGFGQQSAGSMTMSSNTAVMGATMSNYGSSDFNYGDFGSYDRNSDGQVDFNEYSQYRRNAGITTTRAAQEFIRFSNGNGSFSQSDFDNARAMDAMSRPYYRSN